MYWVDQTYTSLLVLRNRCNEIRSNSFSEENSQSLSAIGIAMTATEEAMIGKKVAVTETVTEIAEITIEPSPETD